MNLAEADRLVQLLSDLSGDQRASWLEEHDVASDLRRQVERVLAHFDTILSTVDVLPSEADLDRAARLVPGTDGLVDDPSSVERDLADVVAAQRPASIGPYRVLDVLGRGGMGVVYLAEQSEPRRRVAVKLLRDSGLPDEALLRFEREAELLARLAHPGIAQVYDLGRTEVGAVYIVMEHVDGQPLDAFASERSLTLDARVELLIELAQAVHHAHLRGIVHRDLKPANVLVTGEGRVKVIDFGVARELDVQRLATLQTSIGQIVGTLAYMSPEQIRGDQDAIDARADVYALGVIAYELLSGQLPHDLADTTITEAARRVNDVEPVRLGAVDPRCRGDLERVVSHALAKQPAHRYASAAELAADLARVLNHEAIMARPPSSVYLLGRLMRRHRVASVALVVALASLVVGGGLAWREARINKALARSEASARDEAETSAAQAQTNAERADQLAEVAEEQAALAARRADQADEARAESERRSAELERMTAFQAERLTLIHPGAMAAHFKFMLLEDSHAALSRAEGDAQQRQAEFDALEAAVNRADLGQISLRVLEKVLFTPTRNVIDDEFAEEPQVRARLLYELSGAQYRVGLVDEAAAMARTAYDLMVGEVGASDERALTLAVLLAKLMTATGGASEAMEFQRRNAEVALGSLGPDHPLTLEIIEGIAGLLSSGGDQRGAAAVYDKLVPRCEQALAADDPMLLRILGKAGTVQLLLGRFEQARVMHAAAYEGFRRNPAAVGEAARNAARLATDLYKLERYEEALPLAIKAHGELRLMNRGDAIGHQAIEVAAACLQALGRQEEALVLMRGVLDDVQATLGVGHPGTVVFLHDVAALEHDLLQFQRAVVPCGEAYDIAVETWGRDHEQTLEQLRLLRLIHTDAIERHPDQGWEERAAALDAWGRP